MDTVTTNLFTEKSNAYAKYRAGYPPEAINAILAPFKGQELINVVDAGAGTGIASRLMADRGARITAIEPNGAMIDSAEPHANIIYHQSRAEMTPIDDNFADVVTSFQAFHWFNFKKSLKEFNRILKRSGHLALVWNYWDPNDTFTASYIDLIDEATQKNTDRVEPYDGFSGKLKKFRVRILWKFRHLPYFKKVERHTFKLHQDLDLKGLIGCARSQSYLLHEGPSWDELVDNIEILYCQNAACRLTYNINVFLAKPVK